MAITLGVSPSLISIIVTNSSSVLIQVTVLTTTQDSANIIASNVDSVINNGTFLSYLKLSTSFISFAPNLGVMLSTSAASYATQTTQAPPTTCILLFFFFITTIFLSQNKNI